MVAAAPTAIRLDEASVTAVLRALIAERTGYPQDMLAADLDLEADLGIDSIKRVEIVGALRLQLLPQSASGGETVREAMGPVARARSIALIASKFVDVATGLAPAVAAPVVAPVAPTLAPLAPVAPTPAHRSLLLVRPRPATPRQTPRSAPPPHHPAPDRDSPNRSPPTPSPNPSTPKPPANLPMLCASRRLVKTDGRRGLTQRRRDAEEQKERTEN